MVVYQFMYRVMMTGAVVGIVILLLALFIWLVIHQGTHLRKNAIRLPEAQGSRESLAGQGVTLLHVGESTVAGVGVENFGDSLTAKIALLLSSAINQNVQWQAIGGNGASAAEIIKYSSNIASPDILLITFGVNDTTTMTSKHSWRKALKDCVAQYAGSNTRVFFTAVPPMHKFPLLPVPLNWALGFKAKRLDKQLENLCEDNCWEHIKLPFHSNESLMAIDGYHPNKQGYQKWAVGIVDKIRQHFL